MKPEPKDKDEKERKEEERTAEAASEAAPEEERAFRRRVEAIIDRYRPALKKLAE